MPNTRNKPVTIAPGVERAVLSKAQKTFNDLVARIGKQRARLAAWEAAIAPCHQKYTRELVPALETLAELQKQLVNAFDRASFDKELNNSDQRLIDELIVDLAGQLLLERDDPDLKAVYNRHSDTDYDAAAAEDDTKSMLEDVFGIDPGSLDDVMEAAEAEVLENAQRREAEAASNAQARSARRKSAKHRALDARREDDAQRISQSIREVYRKLASALHPDRETDPDERNRKTALMQRVNQAYAKGNLLQLLELQLELEHIDQAALANISEDRLFHYNSILKEEASGAGATYLDLFPQFVKQAKQGWIAPDGLHPSPQAYAAWAESLLGSFLAK